MNPSMPAWFSKVIDSLPIKRLGGLAEMAGLADSRESVRRALREAQRDRVKIELHLPSNSKHAIVTSIEHVGKDDLAVGRPTIGGKSFALGFGEPFTLSFPSIHGYHTGATRCLGPVDTQHDTAGSAPAATKTPAIAAYRLALPEALVVDDRRGFPRLQFKAGRHIAVQLYSFDSTREPVVGELSDISMSGARIHARTGSGALACGQSLFLKTTLPAPVGEIDELVDIARVDLEIRGGPLTIGVTFRRRIVGLDEVIRAGQSPPARRKIA